MTPPSRASVRARRRKHIVGLDALRGLAAVYVAASHVVLALMPTRIIGQLFQFGQEAVIIFFLLSGAVIYFSTTARPDLSFGIYFQHRFRRIYFPFLVSVAVTALIVGWTGNSSNEFSFREFAGNLLMLQDFPDKPGNWVDPFLGNQPLWSLSYEWAFYLLFWPVYRYTPREHQLAGITLASLLAWFSFVFHPNHASLVISYFVIWWVGLELARTWNETGRLAWRRCAGPLISLAIMALATSLPILLHGMGGLSGHPMVMSRHFGAAFSLTAATVLWSKLRFVGFRWTVGPFLPLAGISYGIYVLHYPILVTWGVDSGSTLVLVGVCLPTLLAVAWLVERRGQARFNAFLNRALDQDSPKKLER